MASNYASSKDMLNALKELYCTFESEENKRLREFTNKCAKMNGLPEIPAPDSHSMLKDLIYNKNRFLKMIPEDGLKGVAMPIPIKYEK